MTKHIIYVISIPLFLFVSCNSEADAIVVEETIINVEVEEGQNYEPKNLVVYSIPSPNEQMNLFYNSNAKFDPSLILPLSNFSSYSTDAKKALNFGVLMSDGAYLTRFSQSKGRWMDYHTTLKNLGKDIGITESFKGNLDINVEELANDSNKLFEVSSQYYLSIYDELIEKQRGVELSFILSGAWIETMHILLTSANKYDENSEIQTHIVDQRFVLENLMGILGDYKDNLQLNDLLKQFDEICQVYLKLNCENFDLEIENREELLILNGGSTCTFDSDSFKEMKSLVKQIRTSIIS
ncbi:hypothetical protein ERX46_17050 [Brumimicrobium glaciale]|uniref:Uncharacterized protein n=1 Tax=Brumimicrobium glaciale TaxID=200475 RepID=A0A4Q4KDT0_9FLAO|nr:hypothetical protein [Brumimicrobium glaciale]RYM30788.1 hypothetical protein ERX46_17050 [Brumimicrobium glaciale]